MMGKALGKEEEEEEYIDYTSTISLQLGGNIIIVNIEYSRSLHKPLIHSIRNVVVEKTPVDLRTSIVSQTTSRTDVMSVFIDGK